MMKYAILLMAVTVSSCICQKLPIPNLGQCNHLNCINVVLIKVNMNVHVVLLAIVCCCCIYLIDYNNRVLLQFLAGSMKLQCGAYRIKYPVTILMLLCFVVVTRPNMTFVIA